MPNKNSEFQPCRNSELESFQTMSKDHRKNSSILETMFSRFRSRFIEKTTMERLEMNGTSDGNTNMYYIYCIYIYINLWLQLGLVQKLSRSSIRWLRSLMWQAVQAQECPQGGGQRAMGVWRHDDSSDDSSSTDSDMEDFLKSTHSLPERFCFHFLLVKLLVFHGRKSLRGPQWILL